MLGTCVNKSHHDFLCLCTDGWTGNYCQEKVNYCKNVTCKNNGVCRPLFRDYLCECVSSNYYGRHCEITTRALVVRKNISMSLSYIAIACLLTVISFFVTMDLLKYLFRIDITRDELERYRRKHTPRKKTDARTAVHLEYVNE